MTIGGQHSTKIMLDRDVNLSGRHSKIHDGEKRTDERYLIPTFSRIVPAESSQTPRSTPKYVKAVIEPGDGGDYKAPVMMGTSTESQSYYEGRGEI